MGKFETQLTKNEAAVTSIVIDQIHKLLKANHEIILFGAGIGGVNTLAFLRKHLKPEEYFIKCFADNNPLKHNTFLDGIPVLACTEAFAENHGELVIVSCGEGDEIIDQLRALEVSEERIFVPDISAIDETDPVYVRDHIREYSHLYDDLEDVRSKEVLVGVINYKLTHDIRYIKEIADPAETQYFDKEIVQFDSHDVFVDCGTYIGDTIQQYMRLNGGKYQTVICFEADHDNSNIIRRNILPNVQGKLYELACWNERTKLLFDKIGSGSGTLNIKKESSAEKVVVDADTIDHMMKGERVTFIKMDIEGAEYKALIGAVDTIQQWKPTLMISVYHKQSDLLQLSTLIKSMNEDYKLYLRHYRSMSVQETILYAVAK